MPVEDVFMEVLRRHKEHAEWKLKEKRDERREMRSDPETTPAEMEEVRRELAYDHGYLAAIEFILGTIEGDVCSLMNERLNG